MEHRGFLSVPLTGSLTPAQEDLARAPGHDRALIILERLDLASDVGKGKQAKQRLPHRDLKIPKTKQANIFLM